MQVTYYASGTLQNFQFWSVQGVAPLAEYVALGLATPGAKWMLGYGVVARFTDAQYKLKIAMGSDVVASAWFLGDDIDNKLIHNTTELRALILSGALPVNAAYNNYTIWTLARDAGYICTIDALITWRAEYDATFAAYYAQQELIAAQAAQDAAALAAERAAAQSWLDSFTAFVNSMIDPESLDNGSVNGSYKKYLAYADNAQRAADWIDSHPFNDALVFELAGVHYLSAPYLVQVQNALHNAGFYYSKVLEQIPSAVLSATHPVKFGDWYVSPNSAEGDYVLNLAPRVVDIYESGQWNVGASTVDAVRQWGNTYALRLAEKYEAQDARIKAAIARLRAGGSFDRKSVALLMSLPENSRYWGTMPLATAMENYIWFHLAEPHNLTTPDINRLVSKIPAFLAGSLQSYNTIDPDNALLEVARYAVIDSAKINKSEIQVKYYAAGGEYFLIYPGSRVDEYASKVLQKSMHFADYMAFINVALASFGISSATAFFTKQATGAIGRITGFKEISLLNKVIAGQIDAFVAANEVDTWFDSFENDLIPFDELDEVVDAELPDDSLLVDTPIEIEPPPVDVVDPGIDDYNAGDTPIDIEPPPIDVEPPPDFPPVAEIENLDLVGTEFIDQLTGDVFEWVYDMAIGKVIPLLIQQFVPPANQPPSNTGGNTTTAPPATTVPPAVTPPSDTQNPVDTDPGGMVNTQQTAGVTWITLMILATLLMK